MSAGQEVYPSPKTNKATASQAEFSSNKYTEIFIQQLDETDTEVKVQKEELKKSINTYKDNVKITNNLFSNAQNDINITFRSNKSFFNHQFSTQELLRSQHLYKLTHELKYTPDRNVKSYPDVLEDGFREILKVNDKDYEIRDSILKWYEHRYDMISFIKKELQREYYQLFSCELDEYSEESNNIASQIKKSDDALIEVEDIIRNLKAEKFFMSQKHYEKQHLPQLSVVSDGNVIIEQTFSKKIKNFPYLNQSHIKRYFNDYVNQHYCSRKIKKVRLLNDYLPYKIQLLHTIEQAKRQTSTINYEENMKQELFRLYQVKDAYILASDKSTIEANVSHSAQQIGINDDINIDFGCLLLFAIDKKFDQIVSFQSISFLSFHPYDLKSPFMTMPTGKKFAEKANELMKTIESERANADRIKIKSSQTWIDRLQILQESDSDQREQDAVFGLYEDTLVNGWIKFLLYTEEDMIGQKLQKDISVLKDRILGQNKKQFEEIYYQFYQRYLKLLVIKSRESLIKILSYMNYFRCLQKNMNLAYVELIIGKSIEGSQEQQPQTNDSSSEKYSENFDSATPLHSQHEKISAKVFDEKFFLTNPSIAQFGNFTQFNVQSNKISNINEDTTKMNGSNLISSGAGINSKSSSAKKNKDELPLNKKKESFIQSSAQPKKSNEQKQAPNVLYEEEEIYFEEDQVIIRDHNDMKILYDSSIHDFHLVLNKISQICSFYFHFKIKHDMSSKEKDKGLFKDNYDREALIDVILAFEQQYYFNKVKLLHNLHKVLINTYYPDLRNQLIRIISKIMARRPRMTLFENDIFQCYHYEIQSLSHFNEILEELLQDLNEEEDQLTIIKNNAYPEQGDKLQNFYSSLKKPVMKRKFNYFMSGLAKLVVNVEMSRASFSRLIPSGLTDPTANIGQVLKCENEYFKSLLESTKQIIYDSDGSNLYLEFTEFRFLEKDPTLDRAENFDIIDNCITTYIQERLTKQDREKLHFDSFSMLEFMKVRKKLNNFLFGLSSLLEIYKLQVSQIGEDFQQKLEFQIDPNTSGSDKQKNNYLKWLLDLGAIKIAKDILSVDHWIALMTQSSSLVLLTQNLYSLILCTQLTLNCVAVNNLYFQAVFNDMPTDFYPKLRQGGLEFFRNIFEIKKTISASTLSFIKDQENNEDKDEKKEHHLDGKNYTLVIFCKRLKREVQFEAMKIQTLLQRNLLENFSKKLPFEQPIFKFTPMTPVKIIVTEKNIVGSLKSESQLDEELDSKGEVFFDSLGCAVKIFRMPSIEQILKMTHDEFELVMIRYGMSKVPGEDAGDDLDYFGDEEKKWEKSQFSGGKDWLKAQSQKLKNQECLFIPNKNIQVNKGSTTLKGFRKREFLEHPHLLYLRKTQLFVLWKILGNMVNILSLITFECSIQADVMDMLFFSHGQLGYEKCRIDLPVIEDSQNQQDPTLKQQQHQDNRQSNNNIQRGKSLKELTFANKNAIPVFKRNELRLRRDLETLTTQLENIERNIQTIRNNPKIADSNEAIMGYLEKYQNRHFLSVLLLLIQQLNLSREKKDFEFMYRLRQLIIELNFPQMSQLARFEDGKILIAQNSNFEDDSADFIQSPDLHIFDSSSPFMNLIRVIFWDVRPNVDEKLHSTINTLNPSRYFFTQFMKYSSILDKGLIGTAQSRVTELSVCKGNQDFLISNFLRANFIFEKEDPFKYERMCTKIIKLQVRQLILRELYLTRKLNILPFESLPNNFDPLKEPVRLAKIKILTKQSQKLSFQQSGIHSRQLIQQQKEQDDKQTLPEEEILLNLSISAYLLQTLFYQEAIDFYNRENREISKWISINLKTQSMTPNLSSSNVKQINGTKSNLQDINKALTSSSLQSLDTLQILSNFTSKILQNSTEVKSLNRNQALVIEKEDLTKLLHNINLDLIDLIELRYSKSVNNINQQNDTLEKDVVFQKKWNKLLSKKIGFMETNVESIVQSQVACRSNELIQEIQYLQKKSAYTADMRKMDQVKVQQDINKEFSDKIKENTTLNNSTLTKFYDFRKEEKSEVCHMIEGIKDQNYKQLKDKIQKALEDHGGSSQAIHALDGVWKSRNHDKSEEEEEKKKKQLQQSQVSQQSQLQITQASQNNNNSNQNEEQHHSTFNYNDDMNDLIPVEAYERIEVSSKEVSQLLESFKLLRAFSNLKIACMSSKYEREIQKINENNSNNEQLYRAKKEMQQQTEHMKEKVLQLKKTMSIMEYQNEILRRDVQKSRIERVRGMKVTKVKDDRIRELEEKVDQSVKEKINTYNNFSMVSMRKKGFTSLTKDQGSTYNAGFSQNQEETSFINSLPIKSTIQNQSIQTTNNFRILQNSRPMTSNSSLSDMLNRRPTTGLLLSKSSQVLPIRQMASTTIERSPEQSQKSNQLKEKQSLRDSVVGSNSCSKKMQLSSLISLNSPSVSGTVNKQNENQKQSQMNNQIKSTALSSGMRQPYIN